VIGLGEFWVIVDTIQPYYALGELAMRKRLAKLELNRETLRGLDSSRLTGIYAGIDRSWLSCTACTATAPTTDPDTRYSFAC
jgi:hypothetical protein